MSEVKIQWTQRAASREVGDIETVERTPFVDAVIAQGRVTVLEEVFPTLAPAPSGALLGIVDADEKAGELNFEAEIQRAIASPTVHRPRVKSVQVNEAPEAE